MLKFNSTHPLEDELRRQVDDYLKDSSSTSPFITTFLLCALFITNYLALLVIPLASPLQIILLVILGILISLIFCKVPHSAVHNSFSRSRWVNKLCSFFMDILWVSSDIWKTRHNLVHHTYTNITNYDAEINMLPFARLHPEQPWKFYFKWQAYYIILIYSLFSITNTSLDLKAYFSKKVSQSNFSFTYKQHIRFWLGKAMCLLIYWFLPCYFHSFIDVLIANIIFNITYGTILSITFQLAHAVDSTLMKSMNTTTIENELFIHQIQTTSDFAVNNNFYKYFLGGVNFQVEHHLFPNVDPQHYPQIRVIINKILKKHNLKKNEFATTLEAILSHWKLLNKLAKPN